MTTELLYWIIGAYLAGSIPFGLLLGFLTGKGDIRKVGSGNIGATNMMRAGGKKLAALTLILDGLKGFIPTLEAHFHFVLTYDPDFLGNISLVFCAAVIGHIFPIWLKFKGGKGVATFLGGLFGLDPLAGLIFIALWGGTFKAFRISALSALTAIYFAPFYMYYLTSFTTSYMNAVAVMSILIIYRHKENISRLMSGNELGFDKKGSSH